MNQSLLYRGGKYATYISLIDNGFDLSRLGSGFGETLGRGVYLTKSQEEARSYAVDGRTIFEVPVVGLKPFKLDRSFSVDSKQDRKNLKKITQKAKDQGFTALESVCGLETVIFEEFANDIMWDCGEILVYHPNTPPPAPVQKSKKQQMMKSPPITPYSTPAEILLIRKRQSVLE
jgi:hypothetical protein